MRHHVGMTDDAPVLKAEDLFFRSLLTRDTTALRDLLADDFAIVDVMSGNVTGRDPLLAALDEGVLTFEAVERDPGEATVRHRPGVAVVIGRTRMTMAFAGQSATVPSRYTHVYAHDGERWRLVSAQGTTVADGEGD